MSYLAKIFPETNVTTTTCLLDGFLRNEGEMIHLFHEATSVEWPDRTLLMAISGLVAY